MDQQHVVIKERLEKNYEKESGAIIREIPEFVTTKVMDN